ncbi:ALF repeat-containing protein [Streptomyces sp. NPDC102406]|uniref:ALF repeat-containing protein n=1 Tax=Streptomyces sp. NPDC102406 TaxID=3366171 RepID=UPI003808CACA
MLDSVAGPLAGRQPRVVADRPCGADKAGDAADEAAKHAGEAADAAAQATKHAAAAKEAADTATAAAATAHDVFDLARETEAEDLTTRTNAAIERAKSEKQSTEQYVSVSAGMAVQAKQLDDVQSSLATEAAAPGADIPALAAKGRRLALDAMKTRGPWIRQASADALSGSDEDVMEFLRTGWDEAGHNEVRDAVATLSTTSPYESVRTAAVTALAGDDQAVEAFYAQGQYTAGADDMAVAVSSLVNAGGPSVQTAGKAALADGGGKALAAFLAHGQYEARNSDEQVIASTLVNDGAPEVEAAAKTALAGEAGELHDFIAVGQYMADRKDQLAATHIAQVTGLVAQADAIALTAQKNRWLAAKAAAEANGAADAAKDAATRAHDSELEANGYADAAKKSAEQAQTSANKAATSATRARNAANAADRDAAAATESAAQAQWSANYAYASAASADSSAAQAEASALAAGKSAKEAKADAKAAWKKTYDLRKQEEVAERKAAEAARKKEAEAAKKPRCVPRFREGGVDYELLRCVENGGTLSSNIPSDPTTVAVVWALFGIDDIVDCYEHPTWTKCGMSAAMVVPGVGEIKGLKGVAAAKKAIETTRVGKIAHLTEVVLKEGKPLGYQDSPGVQIITPDELKGVAQSIRTKLGPPDQLTEVPGKGTVEVWKMDGGNVNYRNFSSSGGAGDATIDFTKQLAQELGFKRYHAK